MSPDQKVSVCIITYNEEKNLPDCLESISWADEIVVVDSISDDKTVKIARSHGCKVIDQEFLGHVKQKDLAVKSAANRWVLCLDADERLKNGAEEEVRAFLDDPKGVLGCFFPRHTYYLGGWINHSGWWPEYRLRLFDRKNGKWTGMDPHDRVEVNGETIKLKSEILHYNYRDITHHMEQVNSYTSIMADRRFQAGQKASFFKMIFNPLGRFFRMYLLRRGFLDGGKGLVIAVIGAFYVFLKYAKLWERRLGK